MKRWILAGAALLLGLWIAEVALDPPLPDLQVALQPPGGTHVFGTDRLGRDVATLLLMAAGYDTRLACAALFAASILGLLLAVFSVRSNHGIIDALIAFVAEGTRSFPSLVLVLLFAVVGIPPAAALIAWYWVPVWRLARTELATQAEQPYVLAARLTGQGLTTALWREALPNAIPRVTPYLPALAADLLTVQVGLEFLGFGPPLEQPTLGAMLADALASGMSAPWTWLPAVGWLVLVVSLLARFEPLFRRRSSWLPVG